MKKLQLFVINVTLLFTFSCGQAQNNGSEKKVEGMLLEFYTRHFQIWGTFSMKSDVCSEKLDSLMQKYCTLKLRNEAREAFVNVGADFLTNDLIGDLNENLKVEKDTANENGYIVSFISDVATYVDTLGYSTKKKVTLYVTVVKEGESYKIDSVK